MPIESEVTTENVDGVEKGKFIVSFTNGAREQIGELQKHFDLSSEEEVIKLAISMLQSFKESNDKKGE